MISVIMPTYNEALNISEMIIQTQKCLNDSDEIVVVDDNSPDATADVVRECQKEFSNIKLIVRVDEACLTTAIQRGIDESSGDIVIWLDCDLSQPPSKIPQMVAPILEGTHEVVVASRYVSGGSDARRSAKSMTVHIQVFLSWLLRVITSWILGSSFADWSSGYIAIKKDVLKECCPLSGDYGEYFMELIYKALKKDFRVIEIPYSLTPRQRGYSKTATNLFGLIKRGRKYLFKIVKLRFSNI